MINKNNTKNYKQGIFDSGHEKNKATVFKYTRRNKLKMNLYIHFTVFEYTPKK